MKIAAAMLAAAKRPSGFKGTGVSIYTWEEMNALLSAKTQEIS